jgi:surface protein
VLLKKGIWIPLILLCSCSKDTPTLQEGAESVFYLINLSVEGSGQISLSPTSADNRYPENSNLEILAVPEEGWSFTHWSGSIDSQENPLNIQLTTNLNLQAHFEIETPNNSGTEGEESEDPTDTAEILQLDNGITLVAINAEAGDRLIYNDTEYLIVDNELLREIVIDQREDLSKLITTLVTDMSYLFENKTTLTPNISSWDTQNVITMKAMFKGATLYNGNISYWNVSKVTDFSELFASTGGFNQDIGGWNTSNATVMDEMFYQAAVFNRDISDWCVPLITNEPRNFATESPLSPGQIPIWGQCPE